MKWLKWIGIVIAALVILPVVTLFAMRYRHGAGETHASVEIAASPQTVWTWIDDGEKLKKWVSWTADVTYPDAQKAWSMGSSRVLVMRDENNGGMLMRITTKCSEYVQPSVMTVQMSDGEGMFEGDQTYKLTDLGNGRTRLDVSSHYRLNQWFANLMEPLVTPAAEKKMKMDVAHLKSLVEGSGTVSSRAAGEAR